MTTEFIQKIIRYFVILLLFICLWNIVSLQDRIAQQYFLQLGIMIIFGLLLKNIWLTLFLWWTVFLFCFYKFNLGQEYLGNVYTGLMLYYLVKVGFKKEHITFFINAVLWVCFVNLVYMFCQVLNWDFVYRLQLISSKGLEGYASNNEPAGFMGFKACMGILMALCVPLLASRGNLSAKIACIGLFLPLYLAKSSICVTGAIIGLLFVLWYQLKKIKWALIVIGLILGAFFYVWKVDMPMNMMPTRLSQWKMTLQDCILHPVTGWGLDSFRKITEQKKHLYVIDPVKKDDGSMGFSLWDNPHNMYISLFFEWGILGLFLLGGYLRQCGIWFQRAIKEPNVIALTGFGLVVLIVSIAQFPFWLSRTVTIIVPAFALFEVAVRS